MRAAETGRRMAIAGVFFALAGAFIFSALLVALIDMGLQIDRGHGVTFSGLMISASLLLFIGLFSVFAGWLAGRDPKITSVPAVTTPPPSPVGELRPLLEAVAVSFLKEYLDRHSSKPAQPGAGSDL